MPKEAGLWPCLFYFFSPARRLIVAPCPPRINASLSCVAHATETVMFQSRFADPSVDAPVDETILWLFRIDAGLTRARSKTTWEERFEDLGNVAGNDNISHQLRSNRCQEQAITKMSSG